MAAERIHITYEDMLHTMEFDGKDWSDVLDQQLQTAAWALRSTIKTTIAYSPEKLAFSRDMIVQNKRITYWEKVKNNKAKASIVANNKENRGHTPHTYNVEDQILIIMLPEDRSKQSKLKTITEGPYLIARTFTNDTIRILRGT